MTGGVGADRMGGAGRAYRAGTWDVATGARCWKDPSKQGLRSALEKTQTADMTRTPWESFDYRMVDLARL